MRGGDLRRWSVGVRSQVGGLFFLCVVFDRGLQTQSKMPKNIRH